MFGLTAIPSNQPGGTNYATSGAKNVTVNERPDRRTFSKPYPRSPSSPTTWRPTAAAPTATHSISSTPAPTTSLSPLAIPASVRFPPIRRPIWSSARQQPCGAASPNCRPPARASSSFRTCRFRFPTGGGAGNAQTRQARLDYSTALWSGLAANGVNFIPADWNSVRVAIAANPSAFGFQFIGTGAGQVACTQPAGINTAWALLCSSNPAAPSTFVTPDADRTRLFADDGHMTTAGQ